MGGGTPTPFDFPGSELIHLGDTFKLTGIDVEFGAFNVMTQEVPNHRISLDGREVFVLDLVGPGKLLTIDVRPMSLASRLILLINGG